MRLLALALFILTASTAGCGPHAGDPFGSRLPTSASGEATHATLPLDDAAIAAKLRDPAALGHVRAFAVDESCFDIKQLPEKAIDAEPLHLTTTNIGGVNVATIDETTAEAFGRLRRWVELLAPNPKRRVVYSRSFEAGKQKGWMATCIVPAPIAGDADFGRVIHKDQALNDKELDVAFSDPALIRMKTLPPNIQRVLFLYDDADVLAMIFLDDLRKLDKPVVTLAKY